ncbi:MAG: biotin/lipoyl-containing protein, partial [Burkholderiales bacterium]
MPKLGADMLQGRLIEWVKKPGDRIERGEIIATIETDKANVDVESFLSGIVERILVEPTDEWLDVGTPLAVIAEAAPAIEAPRAVLPEVAARATPVSRPPAPVIPAPVSPAALTSAAKPAPHAPVAAHAPARIRISPLARKRAAAHGLDLAALHGTGPQGRIVLRDVEAMQHVARAAPAPPASMP